jgi:hypothetical protein
VCCIDNYGGGLFVFLGIETRERNFFFIFIFFGVSVRKKKPSRIGDDDGTSKFLIFFFFLRKWVSLRVLRGKEILCFSSTSLFECKKKMVFFLCSSCKINYGCVMIASYFAFDWLTDEKKLKYPTPFIFCLAVSCTKSDNSPNFNGIVDILIFLN